jgi:hypothetical protein
MKDELDKTLTRIVKKYGNVEDDSLGRLYEDGLNLKDSTDKRARILASEALVEWEKHHLGGHYR